MGINPIAHMHTYTRKKKRNKTSVKIIRTLSFPWNFCYHCKSLWSLMMMMIELKLLLHNDVFAFKKISDLYNVYYLLKQWAAVRTHRGAIRAPPHCWTDCPIRRRATCQGHCPGHCLGALPSGWLGEVECFRVPHSRNGAENFQTTQFTYTDW